MENEYTVQAVEGTTTGWVVTNETTGDKRLVFCREDNSSPEEAVALTQTDIQGD
jgi:hypothetical protein